MINTDCEPTVTLPNGAVVNAFVYQDVAELLAKGARVWLSDEGRVLTWPPVHSDHLFLLDSNSRDVAAVLAAEFAAVH